MNKFVLESDHQYVKSLELNNDYIKINLTKDLKDAFLYENEHEARQIKDLIYLYNNCQNIALKCIFLNDENESITQA